MTTSGWVVFASMMLILAGIFGFIDGLVALIDDKVFLVTDDSVVAMDLTTWGWVHLILGIVVFFASLGVMSGQVWALVVGVIVAMLSAISQILFITVFPLWSITIIAIDILIIYGLVVHGNEVEAA